MTVSSLSPSWRRSGGHVGTGPDLVDPVVDGLGCAGPGCAVEFLEVVVAAVESGIGLDETCRGVRHGRVVEVGWCRPKWIWGVLGYGDEHGQGHHAACPAWERIFVARPRSESQRILI